MASFYELTWLVRRVIRKLTEKDQRRDPLEHDPALTGNLDVTFDQLPDD